MSWGNDELFCRINWWAKGQLATRVENDLCLCPKKLYVQNKDSPSNLQLLALAKWMVFFWRPVSLAYSRAWVLKVHLQESFFFFLIQKYLAVNLRCFPGTNHFPSNSTLKKIGSCFDVLLNSPNTHFFVHWFISHSFTFHQTWPLA